MSFRTALEKLNARWFFLLLGIVIGISIGYAYAYYEFLPGLQAELHAFQERVCQDFGYEDCLSLQEGDSEE